MNGAVSKTNTHRLKSKPLKGLSREELESELASRGVFDGKTKQELQKLLDKEMRGVQRLPALLVNNPQKSLPELGLENYEILPTEPLHDVGHHIDNIFTEFPHHLNGEEKSSLEACITMCLSSKENKRAVDYREALIKSLSFLRKNNSLSDKALEVLSTINEVQEILYSDDEKRSPQLILRYYNQSWCHAILLQEFIQKPKKLTLRKMFGVYYHDIATHGGIMLRLVSGRTSNTEEEERIFNHIKKITKRTSNYSNGQIIPNMLLRLQAEKEMNCSEDVEKQQSFITTLAKTLPPKQNTQIPISVIKKYYRNWQAHLQQISDFLLPGEGVWWRKDGDFIEFNDASGLPAPGTGPKLHHFRSSSLKQEEVYLQRCWKQCIEQQIVIPTDTISIDLPDGSTSRVHTGFLTNESEPELAEDTYYPPKNGNFHVDEVDEEQEEEEEEIISITPAAEEKVTVSDEFDPPLNVFSHALPDDLSSSHASSFPISSSLASPPLQSSLTLNPCSSTIQQPDQDGLSDLHQTQRKTTQITLKSNLCKALANVLGETREIEKFDQRHNYLKTLKRQKSKISNVTIREYYDSLALFQTQILAEDTKSRKQLMEWEKRYIIENNLTSPTYEQMQADKTAKTLLNKLKYSSALLKEWDIDFS